MDDMTTKFVILLSGLGLIYLVVRNFSNPNPALFVLYLFLTLVTRYPKVAIMDTFMLTDCTEVFVYLAAINLGYPLASLLTFIGLVTPQLIEVRMEGPPATINRIISIHVSLIFFTFALAMGWSLVTAITIGIFVSSLIWAVIEWFVLSLTNVSYYAVALAKPVVFYRILKAIGMN